MLDKYELESVRSEKELLEIYDGNIKNALILLERAFNMNCYGAGYKLLNKTDTYSLKETIEFLKAIEKRKESIAYYTDRYTEAYLNIAFDKDYENYLILQYASVLIQQKKKIDRIENAVKYFTKLLGLIKDNLLYLNIDIFLHRLEDKPYSKEKFEYLKKCINLQTVDEKHIIILNNNFKEILCGLNILSVETLENKTQFESKDLESIEFEFPNKEIWDKILNNDLKKDNDVLMTLAQYGIPFALEGDKIVLGKNTTSIGFCTKIFDMIKKYEGKKINMIGAGVKTKIKEETVVEEEEEIKEKKVKVARKNIFRQYNAKKQFLYENISISKEDVTLKERNENLKCFCSKQNEMLRNIQQYYLSKEEQIQDMLEELHHNLAVKREKEMQERMERLRIEEENRKKEEENAKWKNQHKNKQQENDGIYGMYEMLKSNQSGPFGSNSSFGKMSSGASTPATPSAFGAKRYGGNKFGASSESSLDMEQINKMKEMMSETKIERKENNKKEKSFSWKDAPTDSVFKNKKPKK